MMSVLESLEALTLTVLQPNLAETGESRRFLWLRRPLLNLECRLQGMTITPNVFRT